jgi:hypothetical protein
VGRRAPALLLLVLSSGFACSEPNPAYHPRRVPCPADPDLLACYRFEGAARDESPYARATMVSEPAFARGPDGLALDNGDRTLVVVPETTGFDVKALTLEVWVQPRSLPAASTRYGVIDYQRQFALFVMPEGTVRCRIGTNDPAGNEFFVPDVVRPGVWTSLAMTVDARSLSLWVDGKLRFSSAIADFVPFDYAGGVHIGTNYPAGTIVDPQPFDGLVDDVRVWRRVRTPQEICGAAIGCPATTSR